MCIGKPCCRYFALLTTLYYFILLLCAKSKNLPTLIKKFASFVKLSHSGMAVNPRNSNTGIWERIDDLHYVVVLAAIQHSNVSHLEYVRRWTQFIISTDPYDNKKKTLCKFCFITLVGSVFFFFYFVQNICLSLVPLAIKH